MIFVSSHVEDAMESFFHFPDEQKVQLEIKFIFKLSNLIKFINSDYTEEEVYAETQSCINQVYTIQNFQSIRFFARHNGILTPETLGFASSVWLENLFEHIESL